MTSLPLVIRCLQKPDITEWTALRHGLWPHVSLERHRAEISEMLGRGGVRGYGCFLDGEAELADDGQPILIGFAELAIRPYANGCTQSPVPFLEGIFVDEAYRRNGTARLLVAQMSEDLRRQGFSELCSDAGIANLVSHRAHASWGFNETQRVVFFRKALDQG